jgi:hypothetical protein
MTIWDIVFTKNNTVAIFSMLIDKCKDTSLHLTPCLRGL